MRLNPLSGRWVTIAADRAKRPNDFTVRDDRVESTDRPCPFCPGNEEETPPALETIEADGTWSMRVIPNLYPAFDGDDGFVVRNLGPVFVQAEASGIHEVFVFTPEHESGRCTSLDDQHAVDMMFALKRRFADHADVEQVRYTQAIVNHGREAGASIAHPHGQILGLPFVPDEVLDEEKAFARFAGGCLLCTTIEAETRRRSRASCSHRRRRRDHPVLECVRPYELLIIPRRARAAPAERRRRQPRRGRPRPARCTGQLNVALGDIAFNLGFHTAPHQHTGQYHWHAHVWPNLVTTGRFRARHRRDDQRGAARTGLSDPLRSVAANA